MADGAYEAAVKATFETKPLRTVLMIDDEFPTFADVVAGIKDEPKYRQTARAVALYNDFRRRDMLCDIENDVDDVEADHLRKSDLVILDYNLGPGNGNEKSIKLLRTLALSKHFNTIVVYTAEPNQNKVWLEIVASLSGNWTEYLDNLSEAARENWNSLSDTDALPQATLAAVMAYAQRREIKDVDAEEARRAKSELNDLGVPKAVQEEIFKGLLHRELIQVAGPHATDGPRKVIGGFAGGHRWVQSHNSFVAILEKRDLPAAGADVQEDPAGIMAALGHALLSWHPSLFQILISEIQNILESDALATEDVHLGDPETQTALWYYLLQSLGPLDLSGSPDVKVPLMSVIDKVVEGIKRRLSADQALLNLTSDALVGELRDLGLTKETWPALGKASTIKLASTLAKTEAQVKPNNVLFRLNSFFSTEKFRRAHITTGTVFTDKASAKYWIVASPACDLVARQPSSEQAWTHALHPLTAVVALQLQPIDDDKVQAALQEAAQGKHVFLEIKGVRKAFALLNSNRQPVYEFIFAKKEGRVENFGDDTIFRAARLTAKPVEPKVDAGFEGAEPAQVVEAPAPPEALLVQAEQPAPNTVHAVPVAAEAAAPADLVPELVAPEPAQQEDIQIAEAMATGWGDYADDADRELIYENFTIVDQLRGLNATHVLQIAGQHLSRIGLDFMDLPRK